MSRIGKKPVEVPANVNVTVSGRNVTVESGDKRLSIEHRPEVQVAYEADQRRIVVTRQDDERQSRAYHGLTRALIQNMVIGVTTGFKKELEISGVGWTGLVQGRTLALNVGYADTRELPIPMGLDVQVNGSRIAINGADKQAVGAFAAAVRDQRPPEPYNAKGIKYIDEVIIKKEGKAFAGGGA